MQKQKKQFVIVVIMLAILLLAYAGIRFYNSKQEEKEALEDAENSVTVTEIDTDAITAFSYLLDGAEVSFTKDGDDWLYDGDTTYDIDEDAVTSMLEGAASLAAEEELEDYESLSDYGLDTPANMITLTTTDGVTTLYLGNQNEMTSQYYLLVGDHVYLIGSSLSTSFSATVESLVAEEETTEETTEEEITEEEATEVIEATEDEATTEETVETTENVEE